MARIREEEEKKAAEAHQVLLDKQSKSSNAKPNQPSTKERTGSSTNSGRCQRKRRKSQRESQLLRKIRLAETHLVLVAQVRSTRSAVAEMNNC